MIEFQGVSKVFAGHPAVKDLTLELREGAFSVLVGTSGSGQVDDAEDDQPSAGAGPGAPFALPARTFASSRS
ncbi:osmoprotectant ABC transporter ATP-binding subunit YehX [Klebsiella pneumoniae]|uniref:Osmoprotectant ABC transporter ATP-binding subunit YehX n=1 Tax=Klebsiella pneumoniae TaxID=573 RepID=A0A2X3G6J2_KLEPN|nr:osmoprotectant ABC transporter ATP-binding subunit YehX [Klebsiella pneumoniae]